MSESPKKVFLIAMPDSVHVARWLELNAKNNLNVFLFTSSPMRRIHPQLKKLISEGLDSSAGLQVRLHRTAAILAIPLWLLDRGFLFDGRVRAWLIRRATEKFQPDLVHTMESQNGGYSTSRALRRMGEARPTSMLTLFGSDLYWYSRFSTHQANLRRLLSVTDYLQIECDRDRALALTLGFNGIYLGPMPVAGGMDDQQIISNAVLFRHFGSRNKIAIKGYAGTWGRADLALEQLAKIKGELEGFELVLFSSARKVTRLAKALFRGSSIKVTSHKKFALSHAEMLLLFRSSLFYVGYSESDGLPAAMLEAMSQGAFPIQTSTACVDGWFAKGETGLSIDLEETLGLAPHVKTLIGDRRKLLEAAAENREVIKSRYSKVQFDEIAATTYSRVFSKS